MEKIVLLLAKELNIKPAQAEAALQLLDDGNTVPFIARYRKEATGSLDEEQIRNVETRAQYLRNLDARREEILNSIREQEKLTPELEQQIMAAEKMQVLEDLYLPYRPIGAVEIKGIMNQVQRVWVVGSGNMLNYKVYNKVYWNDIPGLLEIDVPEQALDPGITVLAILLDGPVKLYKGAGQVITAN